LEDGVHKRKDQISTYTGSRGEVKLILERGENERNLFEGDAQTNEDLVSTVKVQLACTENSCFKTIVKGWGKRRKGKNGVNSLRNTLRQEREDFRGGGGAFLKRKEKRLNGI